MSAQFIDIDAREPLRFLADLGDRLDDTKPLMEDIAAIMLDAVEENFAQEGRPDWVDLTDNTKARREKRGKWPGKILQDSGLLAASVQARADDNEAAVSTNYPSAPTHQFGAEKGEYGQTKTGLPIPFGDIPARPFLVLGEDDIQEIDATIGDYLDV